MSDGQRPPSARRTTSFHSLMRNSMSDLSSRSDTFSATVRTMKPEPGGRTDSTISRNRRRSLSEAMRREMPM
jgi:hypothetical protein